MRHMPVLSQSTRLIRVAQGCQGVRGRTERVIANEVRCGKRVKLDQFTISLMQEYRGDQ